jgi:hypothetical protein
MPKQIEKLTGVTSELGLTPGAANDFVTKTNHFIEEYNKCRSRNRQDKIAALQKIQNAIREAELHLITKKEKEHGLELQEFHNLNKRLWNDIKKAYAENGVNSMAEKGHKPGSISSILVNMDPIKVDKLMLLLASDNKKDFFNGSGQLYLGTDSKTSEAGNWRSFLKSHSIEFLGGGNSKNYKVTNIADSSIQVLKVENSFSNPRYAQAYLRNKFPDFSTPIYAERQALNQIYEDDGLKFISRRLLVTDFYSEGNLEDCSNSLKGKPEIDRYSETCLIMGQMAKIFIEIQKDRYIFPDAKLSNWLIDNGKVRLADTKSLMQAHDKNFGLIYTPGLLPTELLPPPEEGTSTELSVSSEEDIKPETLHAFLLGINIYEYLTGSRIPEEGVSAINFEGEIFEKELGPRFKDLIKNLIKDPESDRMSLDEARKELAELQLITKYVLKGFPISLINSPESIKYLNEYQSLREKIEAFKISYADEQMTSYLNQCDEKMLLELGKNPFNPLESVLIQSMEETKKGLGHPLNQKIKEIVKGFQREKNKWYSDKKSQQITKAMREIPIEIRAKMIEKSIDDTDLQPLLKALSWGRLTPFGSTNPFFGSTNTNSFKEFKATYEAQKTEAELKSNVKDSNTVLVKKGP